MFSCPSSFCLNGDGSRVEGLSQTFGDSCGADLSAVAVWEYVCVVPYVQEFTKRAGGSHSAFQDAGKDTGLLGSSCALD